VIVFPDVLFQVIRLRKEQAGRAWENLCMAMLGEQFMVIMTDILKCRILSVNFRQGMKFVVWWSQPGIRNTS
jgi:hypothetical protein